MAEQQSNRINSVKDAIKSLKIKRLTDIPVDVPHLWEYTYPNPKPDGSFVVTVKTLIPMKSIGVICPYTL